MYIHGELSRYGFKLGAVHHFGDSKKCHIDYEFVNDKLRAVITRHFDGRIILTFSEHSNDYETVFVEDQAEDEVHIIQLVREFLSKHA